MSKEQTVIKAFISSPSDVADERNVLEDATDALGEILKQAKEAHVFFRQSIAQLPSMSARLNASKRQVLNVLDRFLANFDSSIRLTVEAESVLRSLISK
jgi:hypothetical protein